MTPFNKIIDENGMIGMDDMDGINDMNGLGNMVNVNDVCRRSGTNFIDINEVDLAALAPYAPRDSQTFSESVGEILTHESWRKVLAGIPPDAGDKNKKRRRASLLWNGKGLHPMFEPALDPEDVDLYSPEPAQSEAEDDIYGATPPQVAAQDLNDSDHGFDALEAECVGDQYVDESNGDEDDDVFADIPLPKEDSEDEDFILPSKRRGPRRNGSSGVNAITRRQTKKSCSRAEGGSSSAQPPARQPARISASKAPIASLRNNQHGLKAPELAFAKAELCSEAPHSDSDDDQPQKTGDRRKKRKQRANLVTADFKTPGPESPSSAPSDTAPLRAKNAADKIPLKDLAAHARQLQQTIASLREETRVAKMGYEEAAHNPGARRDPRTKKRRLEKLKETREKLRQAVEEQQQFEKHYGAMAANKAEDQQDEVAKTKKTITTFASSSIAMSDQSKQSRLQVLEQEVSKWRIDIQDMRRKAEHCQAQLDEVEANPQNYVGRRPGFKAGRATRLHNAQFKVEYSIQKLRDQERLYAEEYERVHGTAPSPAHGLDAQPGQPEQLKESDKMSTTAANDQLQSLTFQKGRHKRKASVLEDEEDEESALHPIREPGSALPGASTPVR